MLGRMPPPHITSVLPLDDRTQLRTHAVNPRLADKVSVYWTTTVVRPPARLRIIPDGQVDLVFDLDSGEGHLSGIFTDPFEVTHERPLRLLGATLLPGAAATLLEIAVGDLAAEWQPLAEQLGLVGDALAQRIREAATLDAQIALIESFLLARLGQIDRRVDRALRAITESHGRVEAGRLPRASGASHRNLTRLFHTWVGLPPKRFARIVRVQAALRRLAESPPPELAALASELGFADQAHLAREVRALAGAAPSALAESFKRKADSFNP